MNSHKYTKRFPHSIPPSILHLHFLFHLHLHLHPPPSLLISIPASIPFSPSPSLIPIRLPPPLLISIPASIPFSPPPPILLSATGGPIAGPPVAPLPPFHIRHATTSAAREVGRTRAPRTGRRGGGDAGGAEAKKRRGPERVAPLSEAVIMNYFERGLNLSASW